MKFKMDSDSDSEEQQLMLEFMGIAGETTARARQFLEATNWELGEALQLYFAESNNEVGGSSTSESDRMVDDEDYVRPPLPVTTEALYDDDGGHHMQYPGQHPPYVGHSFVDPLRNFEDEANRAAGGESSVPVIDSLAALYRPPLDYMFQGTFEQAKLHAAREGKWLLVNLQSTSKFASYELNRDTWGDEVVKSVVGALFVLWQVYDDTEDMMKVRTYYSVTEVPSILVVDPMTGQKMHSWEGMINGEQLLEDLERYIDNGPLEYHPIRSQPRQSVEDAAVANTELATAALDLSSDAESDADVEKIVSIVYPSLPEEPEMKAPGACRVGIRFPDSSRGQRRFLMSDSVKLLWSFCSTQVKEAEEGRQFHFIQVIPGENRTLEYRLDATIGEAGVANSMLSMIWD